MNKIDAKDIYDKGITHINIGSGEDVTIKEVAELIKKIKEAGGDTMTINELFELTPISPAVDFK